MNNLHPISVLPFICKVLGKNIVFDQLHSFLNYNFISEVLQFAF